MGNGGQGGRGNGAPAGRGNGRGGAANIHGRGRGAMAFGRGAGGAQNPALQTIEALLAQESRRNQPVLHPVRGHNTLWFGRDKEPRRVIVASIRRRFDGAWYNMSSVPNYFIVQWWPDFNQAFYSDPSHGLEVYRLWYNTISLRLKGLISKAKLAGKRPFWISEDIWEAMCRYWGHR